MEKSPTDTDIIWCSRDLASWYISTVKPTRCTIFRVYWISLDMFRTVFPSIIKRARLVHILMLYVQSCAPDDGRKGRPKHVEWYSINSKNCAFSWFYYRKNADVTWLKHLGWRVGWEGTKSTMGIRTFNPYPTAFPYENGMVLHFYQQQESSTTKTVHKVINKGLKTYV